MKYYVIFEEKYEENPFSKNFKKIMCIVENEEIAKDFCTKNGYKYYIEKIEVEENE